MNSQPVTTKIALKQLRPAARLILVIVGSRSLLLADTAVQHKVSYTRQFAAQSVIGEDNLVYMTQIDLLEQENNKEASALRLTMISSMFQFKVKYSFYFKLLVAPKFSIYY